MNEFFRGWKRKVGCVTILSAFLLTLILVSEMTIELPSRRRRNTTWIEAGSIVHETWETIHVDPSGLIQNGTNLGRQYQTPSGIKGVSDNGLAHSYTDRWLGVESRVTVIAHEFDDRSKTLFTTIQKRTALPYFILPLTMLSAYLLLSKPRSEIESSTVIAASESDRSRSFPPPVR